MIEAVVFDMDGLLIDSEPFWDRAFISAFAAYGVDISSHDPTETIGTRFDHVVSYLCDKFGPELKEAHYDALVVDVQRRLIEDIRSKGEPMQGVEQVLRFVCEKRVKMALASSSPIAVINAALEKLALGDYFEVVHSAEKETRGKPDPAIYLSTLKQLQIRPERALAFEDSLHGIQAAKNAGMLCVCVPDPRLDLSIARQNADLVIESLSDFEENEWQNICAKLHTSLSIHQSARSTQHQ